MVLIMQWAHSIPLHTNEVPDILRRYPLLGLFCRLKIVSLDKGNGTFNRSDTDVVVTFSFWWMFHNIVALQWRKDTTAR